MSFRVAFNPSIRSLALSTLLSLTLTLELPRSAAFGEAPSSVEQSEVADVKGLIAQLGNAKFAIRKSAGEKLARIGLPAYQALEEATRDGDREIRYRAEKVLSVIRQNDLNRRLTIFLASLDSPEDRSLPSWPRFKAAQGNSPLSRGLFVEMQRAEGELLAQLEADPRQATDLLGKRAVALALAQDRDRLNREEHSLSLGQIAAVYFVAGEPDVKPSSSTVALLLRLGTQQSLFAAAAPVERSDKQAAEKAVMARKLLGAVIARAEDSTMTQAVQLAVHYDLKEGLGPALKLLEASPRLRTYLPNALLLVARFGDDSHQTILEKLYSDSTLISTTSDRGVRRENQVRDSALAAAVLLSKQGLQDYFSLPEYAPQILAVQQRAGSPATAPLTIGFENEQQRTAAFRKWDEFQAKKSAKLKK
jgi:hypothetical protein